MKLREKFNQYVNRIGNRIRPGLGDFFTREISGRELIVYGVLSGSALFGTTGCASMGEFYPKDYSGEPVGQRTVESWGKTASDYSKGRVHVAIPRTVGSLLTTANDSAELIVRIPTNSLTQISRDVPIAREVTEAIDYIPMTFFDSAPGGEDFNESYRRLLFTFPGIGKEEWYNKSVPGFFTNSYQRVAERMKLEKENEEAALLPSGEVRQMIEGSFKTAIKLPWWYYFLSRGGRSSEATPAPKEGPGPTPSDPSGPFY